MLTIYFTFLTDARDRMGRMLSFAARVKTDYKPEVIHAIGVDEQTAVLLDITTGDSITVGANQAYICTSDHNPEQCKDGLPLDFKDVGCVRLNSRSNDKFSFKSWSGDGVKYSLDIKNGKIQSAPYGPPSK